MSIESRMTRIEIDIERIDRELVEMKQTKTPLTGHAIKELVSMIKWLLVMIIYLVSGQLISFPA
jgi:hypothetical protein